MLSQAQRDAGAYALGMYGYSDTTGLLTTIAAGTATAGHIWSCRWGDATKIALVTHLSATWQNVVGFTAAQELGLSFLKMSGYTASHTGGTVFTPTGNNLKVAAAFPDSVMTDMRIATTVELTAGTHTIDTHPIANAVYSELSAVATVIKSPWRIEVSPEALAMHPIFLTQDTGLLLRNRVLMGAAGTARVVVTIHWIEKAL